MNKDIRTGHTSLDSEETEGVLVETQPFSDDDENLVHHQEAEEQDFEYDDEEEAQEEEETFEDDDEEMQLTRVGLHDLSTLRNLYRFGLLNTQRSSVLFEVLLMISWSVGLLSSFE